MTKRVFLIAVVVLATLVVPVAQVGASPTAVVPVVVCPTTVGINTSPTPVPASTRVPAPAAHLTVYSAISGYLQVLGPSNFDCQANVGADGGVNVTAWRSSTVNGTITDGGVSAVLYPACAGCMVAFACPFFKSAQRAAKQLGSPSCTGRPRGQVVRYLNAYTVSFYDPPGEYVPHSGEELVPSNSPYPTNGVAIYGAYPYGKYREDVALGAVCVLPASQHGVCTRVLDQFLEVQLRRFPHLSGV